MSKESGKTKSLFDRIKDFLKMGDEGKVLQFFQQEKKKIDRGIKTREKAIEVLQQNLETTVEDLRDQEADAQQVLDNAYTNIQVERLTSNAEREEFSKEYWARIKAAEQGVKDVTDKIAKAQETTKDQVEALELEIKALREQKERIGEVPETVL